MDIVVLNKENLADENICCALSRKSSEIGIVAKKSWLKEQFDGGLKFKKLNARGKVFIEYMPAKNAWSPVDADDFMLINCHWVSGSFKGKGYGMELLKECEEDARQQNMKGVIVIVSNKKRPYLSDKSFYVKHGYEVADRATPYFELLVKYLNDNSDVPSFRESVHVGMPQEVNGIDIFYTAQCPFTIPYVDLLKPIISTSDFPIRIHQLKTRKEAQSHVCPITRYSVFVNGKFFTQEILTAKKIDILLEVYNV